jgi:D-alanyl-D-alanine carboxypeptidase/D-alanyl-D-alanine-endopeptidase (penicillin-binding protein 4)
MKRSVRVLAVLSLGVLGLSSALPASSASSSDLVRRLDRILDRPGLRRAVFSACVVRSATGEVVYFRNPRRALVPASNMKIITSAAALETLGSGFTFTTRVGLCGEALVVIGGGDPLLGDGELAARRGPGSLPVVQDIAARLKLRGVTSVSEIVLDASIFDDQRVHPSWPSNQLGQKYACEVSGLNYNGNCVEITAVNREGRVVLSLDPPTDYLRLINSVTARRFGASRFSVDRTGEPGVLAVSGAVRTQAGPFAVAVENPALFFGRLLRDALLKAGISPGGTVVERPIEPGCDFQPVVEYETSLADCLVRINKDSLGLAAEALCKRLGADSLPGTRGGSWGAGGRVMSSYLEGLGLERGDFSIADGSGLSRDNRLSAWALSRVLVHLSQGPTWEFFKSTLAVGGLDGTIEKHFWEKGYRGRVRAKSGYIYAVRSLSGVVHTEGGDYIFSFLANNAGNGARAAIDAAVKAIVDWEARPTLGRSGGPRRAAPEGGQVK